MMGSQGLSVVLLLLLCTQQVAPAAFKPPLVRYDLTSASIWRCSHNLDSAELFSKSHQIGLEVIHFRDNWVEILSPAGSEAHLQEVGLNSCSEISKVSDLIDAELKENWESLKYHVSKDLYVKSKQAYTYANITVGRQESDAKRVPRSSSNIDGVRNIDTREKNYAFKQYLNLSSIKDWYENLADAYPSVVTLHPSIGKTYYKRDIFSVHITNKASLGGKERPKIYIQCLLHSREWITGPVCMYIADRLVKESLFLDLLQEIEIVIVPVANPDGYHVTWYNYPKYRFWRKNVQPFKGRDCAGVDLNRNFDSHWSMASTSQSDDPCSELYRGEAANSELEIRAISSYFKSLGSSVIGVVDYHSYFQEILYPPAWGDSSPEDIEDIKRVAESVAAASTAVGVPYSSRRMFDVYSATGTFADWLLDWRESGNGCPSMVPLTVELRPKFDANSTFYSGFMLPQSEIYPTCVEMLVAFLEFTELSLETGKRCYSTS